MAVMHDTGDFLPRDEAAHRLATQEETLSIINHVRQGLDEGALGIGFGIAYVPTAPRQEIFRLLQLAADRHMPVFVHMRGGVAGEPQSGAIPALQEVIVYAAAAGVSLHIVHITSLASRLTPKRRIKVGADTDLVAFDPARIIDKATFENAAQYSEGIEHLMAGGVFVVRNKTFVEGVYPGIGMRTK
jgi:dihydroorotase-like cyclic amidohydrolase